MASRSENALLIQLSEALARMPGMAPSLIVLSPIVLSLIDNQLLAAFVPPTFSPQL